MAHDPDNGDADALKACIAAFVSPPIHTRDDLLRWQEKCTNNLNAVAVIIGSHTALHVPALGLRSAAFVGAVASLVSATTIMALLDVDDAAMQSAGSPAARILPQSGSSSATAEGRRMFILVDVKMPKGSQVDSVYIRYAAAAAGHTVGLRLPVLASTCRALCRLLVCQHCDDAMRRRLLPEVFLGLVQWQAWGAALSSSETGGAVAAGSPLPSSEEAVTLIRSLFQRIPPRVLAASLLSAVSGQACAAYRAVSPGAGLTAAVAEAARSAASAAAASSGSVAGAGAGAGKLPGPPGVTPRRLALAVSALMCRLLMTNGVSTASLIADGASSVIAPSSDAASATPSSDTHASAVESSRRHGFSGVEAVADAMLDAVDSTDPVAVDRALLTTSSVLSQPPTEMLTSADAYLAAVAPQLLRLLRLRGDGAVWLHSVAASTLGAMLSSRHFMTGGSAGADAAVASGLAGAGAGSGSLPLLGSADVGPAPAPQLYIPLHSLASSIVAPLLRPLLLFASACGCGCVDDESLRRPGATGSAVTRYLRRLAGVSADGVLSAAEAPFTAASPLRSSHQLADEGAVAASVELLHALLTQGPPLLPRIALLLFAPALPALFLLYTQARVNKLRSGFAAACLEAVARLLSCMPNQAAAAFALLRAAAAAAIALPADLTSPGPRRKPRAVVELVDGAVGSAASDSDVEAGEAADVGAEAALDMMSAAAGFRRWYSTEIRDAGGNSTGDAAEVAGDRAVFEAIEAMPLPLPLPGLRRQLSSPAPGDAQRAADASAAKSVHAIANAPRFVLGANAGYTLRLLPVPALPHAEATSASADGPNGDAERRRKRLGALIGHIAAAMTEVVAESARLKPQRAGSSSKAGSQAGSAAAGGHLKSPSAKAAPVQAPNAAGASASSAASASPSSWLGEERPPAASLLVSFLLHRYGAARLASARARLDQLLASKSSSGDSVSTHANRSGSAESLLRRMLGLGSALSSSDGSIAADDDGDGVHAAGSAMATGLLLQLLERLRPTLLGSSAASPLALYAVRSVLHMTVAGLGLPIPRPEDVGLGRAEAAAPSGAAAHRAYAAYRMHMQAAERFAALGTPTAHASTSARAGASTATAASVKGTPEELAPLPPLSSIAKPLSQSAPKRPLISVISSEPADGGGSDDEEATDHLAAVDSAPASVPLPSPTAAPSALPVASVSVSLPAAPLLYTLLSAEEREETEDVVSLCLSLLTAGAVALHSSNAAQEVARDESRSGVNGAHGSGAGAPAADGDDVAAAAVEAMNPAAADRVWIILRSSLPLLAALSSYGQRSAAGGSASGLSSVLSGLGATRGGDDADEADGGADLAGLLRRSGLMGSPDDDLGLGLGLGLGVLEGADADADVLGGGAGSGPAALRGREIAEMSSALRALLLTMPAPQPLQAAASSTTSGGGAGMVGASAGTPGPSNSSAGESMLDAGGGRMLTYNAVAAEAVQLIAVTSEPALQSGGCRLLARAFRQAARDGPVALHALLEGTTALSASSGSSAPAPRSAAEWAKSPTLGARGSALLPLLLQQLAHPDAAVNLGAIDALSALAAVCPAAMLPVLLVALDPESASLRQTIDLAEHAPTAATGAALSTAQAPPAFAAARSARSDGFYLGASLQDVLDADADVGARAAAAGGGRASIAALRASAAASAPAVEQAPLAVPVPDVAPGGGVSGAAATQAGAAAAGVTVPSLPARLRARVCEVLALALRRLSGGSTLSAWAPTVLSVLLEVGARGWRRTEALAAQLVLSAAERRAIRTVTGKRPGIADAEADGDADEDAAGAGAGAGAGARRRIGARVAGAGASAASVAAGSATGPSGAIDLGELLAAAEGNGPDSEAEEDDAADAAAAAALASGIDGSGSGSRPRLLRAHPYNIALALVDWADLRACALACLGDALTALAGPVTTLTGSDHATLEQAAAAAARAGGSTAASFAALLVPHTGTSRAEGASSGGGLVSLPHIVSALAGVLTFEAQPLHTGAVRAAVRSLLPVDATSKPSEYARSAAAAVLAPASEPGLVTALPDAMQGGDAETAAAVPEDVSQVIAACAARVRRAAASTLRRLVAMTVALPASAVQHSLSPSATAAGAASSSRSELSAMRGLLAPGASAMAASGALPSRLGGGGAGGLGQRPQLAVVASHPVADAVRAAYSALQSASSSDGDATVRQHALHGLGAVDEALRGALGLDRVEAAGAARAWIAAPSE